MVRFSVVAIFIWEMEVGYSMYLDVVDDGIGMLISVFVFHRVLLATCIVICWLA